MKPNHKKNAELIKQYPFVNRLLGRLLFPLGENRSRNVENLTIKVEKADGDLLFRYADNTGLDENSFSFVMEGKRKGQIKKQGEYIFAVDANNEIINHVYWPKNEAEALGKEPLYAWAVLWDTRHADGAFTGHIADKVKYLVWVTVEAWHEHSKNSDAPFGKFIDRNMKITIYGAPEQGFDELQQSSNVYENLYLGSRTLIDGVIRKNYDLISIGGMLGELCVLFQNEVYFNGMKKILDEGKYRGASGTFGSTKILAAEMCGYDRVMLEDSVCFVTFQLRPGAKGMYVLGQGGTLPQIRNLVMTVVKAWNNNSKFRESFKPDENVSVI